MQKRLVGAVAVLVLAAMPLAASASVFVAQPEYALSPQERVEGNVYVAASNALIGARVNGDLLAAGGMISVTGPVSSDAALLGGTVQVLGPVGGDLRVVGGQITVNDRVGGDLVVAGGTLTVLSGASVDGDVYVAGGQVVLDGVVRGSVHMTGGRLVLNGVINGNIQARTKNGITLGSGARIGGDVSYEAPQQLVMPSGAQIGGTVRYTPMVGFAFDRKEAPRQFLWAIVGMLTAMRMLAILGLVALLMWRWRRWVIDTVEQAHDAFWRSIGQGLVYAVFVPLAAILLLFSIVGSFAGGILLMAYIVLMILTKALAGVFLGAWLVMAVRRRAVMRVTWGNAIGGVILLQIIGLIPVLGWIVSALLTLALFGVLAYQTQKALE